MAFVSTAISPIMTISTFGTFAAIAILVNYIMVITWFPAVILSMEIHVWPYFGFKWGPQDEDVWNEEFANLPNNEEKKGKCCDQCRIRPGASIAFLIISAWASFMIY